MKRTLIALVAFSISLQAFALDLAEKHRLGAYLTFIVVTSKDIGGGTPSTPDSSPAGGVCGECNGVGKVGDGVVMFTCGACGGTGKSASSSTPDVQSGTPDTPSPPEPQLSPSGPQAAAQSQEASTASVQVASSPAIQSQNPSGSQGSGQSEPPASQEKGPDITQIRQSSWDWQGRNNPSDSVMRKHLMAEHDVDPSSANKMSRQEMIAMHNLLHNSEVRAAAPKSSKSRSSSSCPSGNCPTSSSSSSSRYRLFRRR